MVDEVLYEKLLFWRKSLAEARRVEPYKIMPNRILDEVADVKPECLNDLVNVNGFDSEKYSLYSDAILDVVCGHKINPKEFISVDASTVSGTVLKVFLEEIKDGVGFQIIWFENDEGANVLQVFGDFINKICCGDKILVKEFSFTRRGPPAYMKLLRGGSVSVTELCCEKIDASITYLKCSFDEFYGLIDSCLLHFGKLGSIHLRGLASMGKGDAEVPYNIYGMKKGGYAIMHIVKGDKNHFFMSKKIPELIEAAEDESKLAEIAAAKC